MPQETITLHDKNNQPMKKTIIDTYEDGIPCREIHYEYGLKHGSACWFDRNGDIMIIRNYKKGKKVGVEEFWASGKYIGMISYRNEKQNGLTRFYYRNGKLKYETSYKNGVKHGVSKSYGEKGELLSEAWYEDGRLINVVIADWVDFLKNSFMLLI